jgi:ribosomal subunit interface protein
MCIEKEHDMSLSWNIVSKNVELHEALRKKFRQKIAKLEQHLQHFPKEAVYLQIVLERHPKKELFTTALNLRLPSNILRSVKSAADPVPAFDQAVKVLLRELITLKSDLRRERQWQSRRGVLREAEARSFAAEPLPPGQGPQALGDLVRKMIEAHHGRLTYYVGRLIWRAKLAGMIPPGSVDAAAVVDEVAREDCLQAEEKPKELSYRLWFYSLARQDYERRLEELRDQQRNTISLESTVAFPEETNRVDGQDTELPLSAAQEHWSPAPGQLADALPDVRNLPPDLAASEHDLIDHLQKVSHHWPPRERSIFELYFIEGFEPDEVAMMEGVKTAEITKLIPLVQARLRSALMEELESKVAAHAETRYGS